MGGMSTLSFTTPPKKQKFAGVRSSDLDGHEVSPLRPLHLHRTGFVLASCFIPVIVGLCSVLLKHHIVYIQLRNLETFQHVEIHVSSIDNLQRKDWAAHLCSA
jgi:hypothetical protein